MCTFGVAGAEGQNSSLTEPDPDGAFEGRRCFRRSLVGVGAGLPRCRCLFLLGTSSSSSSDEEEDEDEEDVDSISSLNAKNLGSVFVFKHRIIFGTLGSGRACRIRFYD